ncbi:MAG: hypothetical protein ACREPV_08945 [Lysobacter sp.]
MNAPRSPIGSPFVAPAWIGAVSIVGLVSALVGDGAFDLVSWLVFVALLALAMRAWLRRNRGR